MRSTTSFGSSTVWIRTSLSAVRNQHHAVRDIVDSLDGGRAGSQVDPKPTTPPLQYRDHEAGNEDRGTCQSDRGRRIQGEVTTVRTAHLLQIRFRCQLEQLNGLTTSHDDDA
jgi:hypothetical protein